MLCLAEQNWWKRSAMVILAPLHWEEDGKWNARFQSKTTGHDVNFGIINVNGGHAKYFSRISGKTMLWNPSGQVSSHYSVVHVLK